MDGHDGRTIYVIVLGQVVVAQDIAQAIAEYDPGATVITTPRREDAVAALYGMEGRLAAVFINTPPRLLADDRLGTAARARGGQIVLIHDEAEVEGERDGYLVLPRPFTTDLVVATLMRAAVPQGR